MSRDLAHSCARGHLRSVARFTFAVIVTATCATTLAASNAGSPHHTRFSIRGDVGIPLSPGVSRPLNLALANRHHFALWVTRLRIGLSVDRGHTRAGCAGRRNFSVRQLPSKLFPLRLRAGRTRTLRGLGVKRLPRVGMRDLRAVNQDSCKGARLTLTYQGTATSVRPVRRVVTGRRA